MHQLLQFLVWDGVHKLGSLLLCRVTYFSIEKLTLVTTFISIVRYCNILWHVFQFYECFFLFLLQDTETVSPRQNSPLSTASF